MIVPWRLETHGDRGSESARGDSPGGSGGGRLASRRVSRQPPAVPPSNQAGSSDDLWSHWRRHAAWNPWIGPAPGRTFERRPMKTFEYLIRIDKDADSDWGAS